MTARKPPAPCVDLEALAQKETLDRLALLARIRRELEAVRRDIKIAEAECGDIREDVAVLADLRRVDPERYARIIAVSRKIIRAHHTDIEDTAPVLAWGVTGKVLA